MGLRAEDKAAVLIAPIIQAPWKALRLSGAVNHPVYVDHRSMAIEID